MSRQRTLIIAEAGVNHNGVLGTAKELIDVAADAGADFVKFQTFFANTLVSQSAEKAEYQKSLTGADESQYEMIKRLELDRNDHRELMKHCRNKGIEFLSTAFDIKSIDLLSELDQRYFKISSGEITNLPYLRKIGALEKEIFLSTGMADLGEIEDALDVLMEAGTKLKNITVLHCNTEYPTPMQDVNLRAMETIALKFGVRVGYSDHTLGIEVPIAAVARNATVIEKHFTLDKNMEGPDHKASLEPNELKAMVHAIRNIEQALGSSIKKPSPSELKNKPIARKRIVAARNIKKDEAFTHENITVKRPGTGISPMMWDEVIGKVAKMDYFVDDPIKL